MKQNLKDIDVLKMDDSQVYSNVLNVKTHQNQHMIYAQTLT